MTRRATATARDAVRALNQNAVFQAVHRYGPISRIEIASRLQLSPAAVTSITSDLIGRGLVYEARQAEANGVGRRAILLEVDYDSAYVVGIKLSNVGLTYALTNLNAEVVRAASHPIATTNPANVVEAIGAAFEALRAAAEKPVTALGIDLPGIIDTDQQTVRHSPLLGWNRVPLGRMLTTRLGVPVLVENDVNALALAEAWFGHGRDHDSFLVVTLGRGVGLGIVLNGEVYRGPNGGAGEFGHVLLDPQGPRSQYADRGTLEAYLSDDALLREARARIATFPQDGSPDTLADLARNGHPEARTIYQEAGRTLGRALSNLVNILAPNLIILSGEGMRGADFLLPTTESELQRLAFGDLAEHVRLVVDPWGDDAWARGAAGLAASRYLVDAATTMGGD